MPSPETSSRIIVKNLPKYMTLPRLKSHFESRGAIITDAKLAHTKSGTFRRFGYIGFKTEEEASQAVEYFNNTYIDTCRIIVEFSFVGQVERPWSKYSEGSSAHSKVQPGKNQAVEDVIKTRAVKEIEVQDPKLQEFLSVVGKGKNWSNDDVPNSLSQVNPEEVVEIKTPEISDLEYLKQKARQGITLDDQTQPEELPEIPPADLIADTGRLMVKNISFMTTVPELEKLFAVYGPLSEVHIPIHKDTKQSKGFAFVLFMLPEHAVKAYSELDGAIFQGRLLSIIPAKERPGKEVDTEAMSFKDKRALEQRKTALKQQHTWNSLFMNQDAIVAAMANKLNVSKSEILDPASDNMAVRLALSETQIINETKEYLIEQGVHLDAFSGTFARSDTVILVKNISFETELDEIEKLFARYGALNRVVLPPTRTVALVEFIASNEAKGAFKRLAYTRFKSLPLYLEWAPVNSFIESKAATQQPKQAKREIHNLDDGDSHVQPVATLFIKNLNFSTSENDLKQVLSALSGFVSAKIATKKVNGQVMSMGFGFAEFDSKENAVNALSGLQGYNLHDHALVVKFSSKKAPAAVEEVVKDKTITGTKLLVRNIPFEATKRDIKQLFAPFGQIKSIRVPTKIDGTHRGFGFVDFLSVQEAKNAFISLSSTHLYGRHLVLEWADDDESIEAVRQKTKKGFIEGDGNSAKKRRVVLGEGDLNEEY